MLTTRRFLPVLIAVSVGLAGSAYALDEAWNQEEAAKLARDLTTRVEALVQTAKVEDGVIGYGGKGAENYLLIQDMQQLRRHSARLAKQLENGDDREATSSIFARIQRIVRSIVDRRGSSPLLSGSQAEIDQARAAYESLAALYGVEPVPPPPVAAQPTQKK